VQASPLRLDQPASAFDRTLGGLASGDMHGCAGAANALGKIGKMAAPAHRHPSFSVVS
jgi:hypothetical protein